MNNLLINQNEILTKKQLLENAKSVLKQEFIGLDTIIDEIFDLLLPWWIFPDFQQRPTIINLWGMTGTGKTALIKRMVELLAQQDQFLMFDMGSFGSGDNSLKDAFTGNLEHFNNKNVIIALDEFQFARTIDGSGDEISNSKLRIIWDLLDSGQFTYETYVDTYFQAKILHFLKLLSNCCDQQVEIRNGLIVSNLEFFEKTIKDFTLCGKSTDDEKREKNQYFISDHFINVFDDLIDGYFDKDMFLERIKLLNINGIIEILFTCLSQQGKQKQMDLSKALIFVIGNLDEAFYMSHNINPDISADEFHKSTKKINISTIKSALQERFRNEQIARLGNNHLIYPAFSSENYRNLILKKLEKVRQTILEKFGFELNFDKSIIDLIYQEGVFPTQGARPVLTTIRNLIDSYTGKIFLDILENDLAISQTKWFYEDEKYLVEFWNETDKVLVKNYALSLKINPLRKSQNNDTQAYVALHEAGHAVLSAICLRLIPEYIVTRTVDSDTEGFCLTPFPEDYETKDLILNRIKLLLGGYLAEKMILGENYTSTGVSEDISRASALANNAIRRFAMGNDPIWAEHNPRSEKSSFRLNDFHASQALTLVKQCEAEAAEILQRNELLLLKLTEYLTVNSRMNKDIIQQYVEEFSVEPWIKLEGFRDSEKYYDFKSQINARLVYLENEALVY